MSNVMISDQLLHSMLFCHEDSTSLHVVAESDRVISTLDREMISGMCYYCGERVYSWEGSRTEPVVRRVVGEGQLLWFQLPGTFVIEEMPTFS